MAISAMLQHQNKDIIRQQTASEIRQHLKFTQRLRLYSIRKKKSSQRIIHKIEDYIRMMATENIRHYEIEGIKAQSLQVDA